MSRLSKTIVLLLGHLAAATAAADIFVFTDENGVTRFSNVPVDSRYRLVLESAPDETADESIVNPRMIEKSARYNPIIEGAAADLGMDAALLRAVIVVESGFDEQAVSHAGAEGLMQLMPDTANHYGVSDTFDPEQNINAGARHLRELIGRFDNDLELALAAYNAGEGAVERYGRRIPPYDETRRYVPKVMRIYRRLLALDQSS